MNVIRVGGPIEWQCSSCNSKLEIAQGDITAIADPLWAKQISGWPDYNAEFICPVCNNRESLGYLDSLPFSWRNVILGRSGLTGKEREEQYK